MCDRVAKFWLKCLQDSHLEDSQHGFCRIWIPNEGWWTLEHKSFPDMISISMKTKLNSIHYTTETEIYWNNKLERGTRSCGYLYNFLRIMETFYIMHSLLAISETGFSLIIFSSSRPIRIISADYGDLSAISQSHIRRSLGSFLI